MLISTNAIVLKRISYSDSSLICRIFTKESGKITIIAKGAKRPKNIASAVLEPINHIHLEYYQKNTRNIQILKNCIFIQNYSFIRNNLNKLLLALSVVEIIDKSMHDGNPQPIIYKLTWRIFEKLNNKDYNHWIIYIFFLYHFSVRLGFKPDIKYCGKCNTKMEQCKFDNFSGELCCHLCLPNQEHLFNSNSLIKLSSINIDKIEVFKIPKGEILNIITFFKLFLSYHIEGIRKLKSMHFIMNTLKNI